MTLFMCLPLISFTQTGPGGVGTNSSNGLWLRASALSLNNGDPVSSWTDKSAYSNNADNSVISAQPTFLSSGNIHGRPSLNFDGTDQLLVPDHDVLDNSSGLTYYSIIRPTGLNTRPQGILGKRITHSIDIEYAYTFFFYNSDKLFLDLHTANNRFNTTTSFSNATNYMPAFIFDGSLSSSQRAKIYSSGNLIKTSSESSTSIPNSNRELCIGALNKDYGTYFSGEIAEICQWNYALNTAERIIVENYLGAKYGLTIANDFYSYQDTHAENVAGIGQASDGTSHTQSKGSGIFTIQTPSSLSNNEYLFWGENIQNTAYDFTTSSDYMERQRSTWRVSKTGDLGTVTVSVSATSLDLSQKQSCANLNLIVSSSSSFTSKTIYELTLSGGDYTATNVNFTDGDYFTLEYQDQIVVDGSTYLNGSGLNESPNTTDACYKLFVKSNASNLLFLQQDAVVREVEIENGGIFNINDDISLTTNGSIENNGIINVAEGSSIIQTHTGTNNNSGTGTYQVKRVGNNSAFVYNIWSSPIESAAITSIFPGGNPCDIFVFEESTQSWKHDFPVGYSTTCYGNAVTFTANNVISSGDGNMDIARGYFAPGNSTSTRSYSGTINNGEITIPITTTNLINPGGNDWGDDDWNLIGNPYPSAISAASFWTENAQNNNRIMDAVYFWDEADTTGGYNQHSDYASWNLSGGVNSGNSVKMPQGHIASGQGFWVVASTNTNVVFTNSMRTGTNSQFFKTTPNTQQHNAWVSFASPSNYKNNILVGYNKMTTDSFDQGYDAHKLVGNGHVRFASVNDSDEFVIQSVAPLAVNDTKVIPLVVFTDQSGTHVFSNYLRKNLNPAFEIYLRDLQLGTDHDLGLSDYEVTLTANTEYTQRFQLVFVNKLNTNSGGASSKDLGKPSDTDSTGIVNSMSESISNQEFSVTQTTNEITIQNPKGFSGAIQVVDITGKVVFNKTRVINATLEKINIGHLSNGVYFITLRDSYQLIYTQQFIKL